MGESEPEVIVALDFATVSGTSKEPAKTLKPGDFVWLEGGAGHGKMYKNESAKDARYIEIVFKPAK